MELGACAVLHIKFGPADGKPANPVTHYTPTYIGAVKHALSRLSSDNAEGNDDDQAQQRRRLERTDASTGGCRGRQDEHGPIVASRDGCAYADG